MNLSIYIKCLNITKTLHFSKNNPLKNFYITTAPELWTLPVFILLKMYPKNFLANVIPTGLFSAALNVSEIYPTHIQVINRKEIKEILKLSNLKPLVI